MAERRFRYDDPVQALIGLMIARELVLGDPGIKYARLNQDREGGFTLTVTAGEASHWMSSSGEQPGTERQAYVLRQLGHELLEQVLRT